MIRAVLLTVCGAALAAASSPQSAITYGHAAYVYPPFRCDPSEPCAVTPSCNKASFAKDIAAFNKDATTDMPATISTVYSYGGDVEFWPEGSDPHACWPPATDACNASVYFDPNNQAAAQIYKDSEGVKNIVALLDGRMDGWSIIETYNDYDACQYGDFYPALQNLTDIQIKELAAKVASLYCTDDLVDGIQVDLEPFADPYTLAVSNFVMEVGLALADAAGTNGCRTAAHPHGRSVSYFTFAHSQSHEFTKNVLRENGQYVFSLYDLDPKPEDGGFMYNTVDEFGEKLRYELNFIPAVVEDDGKFTVAIPISASCHEYEKYVPMSGIGCGEACTPETNTATMVEYVEKAMEIMLSEEVKNTFGGLFCVNETAQSQFTAVSLWVWTDFMSYPSMKWFDNLFEPPTPNQAVLDVLHKNLHRFSTEEACAAPACDADSDKPNGCACTHSEQCKSDWCTGKCSPHPDTWIDTAPHSWTRQYGNPKKHTAVKGLYN